MKFDYNLALACRQTTTGSVTIDIESIADDDHILRQIKYQNNFYEWELLDHLGLHGPRGGVYIDVGANIGNHAIFFGKFLADSVIAIEPSPRLIPILERNLTANDVRHFAVIGRAVGAAPGTGKMHLPDQFADNLGASQVLKVDSDNVTTNNEEEFIEITTIDRIIERLQPYLAGMPITFMKIDIEGMELEALKGATMVLEDYLPQLVVELPTPDEFATVSSFLRAWGYRDVARFGATPTYHFTVLRRHSQ